MSERAQARMVRQRILEYEQQLEDIEAMKMTPEELRTLQDSFAEVKTEFVDLDGQSWETATAREMLVDWHARQAMREEPVPFSPGGLRMRRPQPRRSLSALVSPSPYSSSQAIAVVEDEDVFSDETVRARPGRVSRICAMVLPTVDDDDDDPNDTTLTSPPDLSSLVRSGSFQPPEPSAHWGCAPTLSSTPVFTFTDGSTSRSFSAPASTYDPPASAPGKAVLSSSPTLNRGPSLFDAATVRAGPSKDTDSVAMARPKSRMGWNIFDED
ncbi:hypothetical protein L226DRAFT_540333 [Lentinus tigrinus ALCF2SS1-7]|uniref:uncharacterized protein n=1 Tax=Lentinus tigrinus ALCF2SS1-7 TaxID=1328758 RepID=UPI001165F6F4|nr:hypothetical protein L226DRAFT_540333 [Lentinus tigrinus ALCF2SS1-7]